MDEGKDDKKITIEDVEEFIILGQYEPGEWGKGITIVLSTVKTVDDAGTESLWYERVYRNTTCHAEESFLTDFQEEISKNITRKYHAEESFLTDFQEEISKKNHSNKKFKAYLYQNYSPCDSCASKIIGFMDEYKDFDISFKIKFANIYEHDNKKTRKKLSKLYKEHGIDLHLIQGEDDWEDVLALPFLDKLTDAEKGQLRNRTKEEKRKDNEEKGKIIFEKIINAGRPDVSSQSERTDESESTGKAKTPSEAKTQDNSGSSDESDSSDKGESRKKRMCAAVSGSGKGKITQMNSLVHNLAPHMFITLFTVGKCTTEEIKIREILKDICALRNSGGGRLTIRLTEICLSSDVQKCVEIIEDAVDKVLSETNKTDLLALTSLIKIIFLVRGSKEFVIMKYNEEAKIVPKTKSAEKQQSPAKHGAPQPIESSAELDGFFEDPESYEVKNNVVEKIPSNQWMFRSESRYLQDSLRKATFVEFKENENTFEKIFSPSQYQTKLKSLEWVESFKVVGKNDECDADHLEIVCKFDKVPCNADIVTIFGEDVLSFITYKRGSHREWFETNIFDENYDMQQEYEDKLFSLPWVEGYYVGVTTEPEKSWQIYITCAPKFVPSMKDLKKEFGTDISCFVDFVQESDDENSKDSKESIPSSSFLRGPISGDKLCRVQEGKGAYGAVGILTCDGEKHYATTCYHVCFKEDLPEDIKKGHEILKKDCEEQSEGCEGTTYVYTPSDQEETLGTFCCGLFDDNHDIALIELQPTINCSDTVEFLANKSIRPALASKKEVKDMFYEMAELPVEIIKQRKPKKGKLFAATGGKRGARNKRCYRIKRIGETDFAKEGDSGSLVYLVYEGEKIPFAYVCMVIPESDKVIYYCRSMAHSIEQLIKEHRDVNSDMKPCLGKCGQPTAD